MTFKRTMTAFAVLAYGLVNVNAQERLLGDDYLDLGPFNVRPFAEARVGYDSNVLLEDDSVEKSDTFVAGRLGLDGILNAGPLKLGGTVLYYWEEFFDVNEADDDDLEVRGSLAIGEGAAFGQRDRLQFSVDGSYGETDEVDLETGDLEDRKSIKGEFGIGRTFPGFFGDVDLGYRYEETRFRSTSLVDQEENTVFLSLAPQLSERTWIVLHGEYGEQSISGGADEDYAEVRVGFRSQRTDKTMISAQVGWIEHSTRADTVGFDLSALWQATEKTQVTLSAGNEVNASSTDAGNQNIATQASLGVRFRASDAVLVRGDVTFTQNDLKNDLADGTSRDSDTWKTSGSVVYGPPGSFYNVFAEIEYLTRDSKAADDTYDQLLAALGAVVFF